jgi:small subunit ribosomal protein S17
MSEIDPQSQAPKGEATEPARRGQQRRLIGRVVNDTQSAGRARKTVVVEVIRFFRDPFYGKYVKRRRRFHAHDERESCRTRDLVEIRESRPISKTKRWVVARLIERPPEV